MDPALLSPSVLQEKLPEFQQRLNAAEAQRQQAVLRQKFDDAMGASNPSSKPTVLNYLSCIVMILLALISPPMATGMLGGCTADIFVNILLSILLVVPGQIHALYLVYTYYRKQEESREGYTSQPAVGIWSEHVQSGGRAAPAEPSKDKAT